MNMIANRSRAKLELGRIVNNYELLVPVRSSAAHETWVARRYGTTDALVAISFGTRTIDPAPLAALPPSAHFVNELERGRFMGIAYYVSEWIDGDSLLELHQQALLRGGPLAQRTSLPILVELLDAILALRSWFPAAPLVVPDPSRVIIDMDGHVKILDGAWRSDAARSSESALWLLLEILTEVQLLGPNETSPRLSFLPAHNADSLTAEVLRLIETALATEHVDDRQLFGLAQGLHMLLARCAPLPDPKSVRLLQALRMKSTHQRKLLNHAIATLSACPEDERHTPLLGQLTAAHLSSRF